MSATTVTAPGVARSELETSTIRTISWRLIPFLVLAYFFSYLDRVNLGFAALTVNAAEILPDHLRLGRRHLLHRLFHFRGAEQPSAGKIRRQPLDRADHGDLGHHLGADGAGVGSVEAFYALRFLLGVAEAGFFPGIILYLTYWYPAEYRARFLAAFAIAVPMSSVIGAPISGLLLGLDGALGLKGWQWLFVIEGIPSCCSALSAGSISPTGRPRPIG